jgi:hypothetical protein
MSTSGLGFNRGLEPNISNLVAQKIRAEHIVRGGASWFLWVAGLSMLNSVLALSGSSIRFIFGLGFAQVVDAFAHAAGNPGTVLDLFINGCVAGIFVLFWNFAQKGEKWAFTVGLVFYALDALLMILFKDFLGLAFHAYVIYRIVNSMGSLPALARLREATAAVDAPITPI